LKSKVKEENLKLPERLIFFIYKRLMLGITMVFDISDRLTLQNSPIIRNHKKCIIKGKQKEQKTKSIGRHTMQKRTNSLQMKQMELKSIMKKV